ncbi:MAG: hypothetical protein QOH61_123 [Chloroflexota bacterium]|jgi:hypothetical protein|nr:hypothetical protein [Chloroflexota bacterium]
MKVIVLMKADERSEAGQLPDERLIGAMMGFNEELVQAGVMLAGEGLHPSSRGAKVRWSGGKATVIDGPFTEAKELVAGFWLWQVRDMDEATEWVKRMYALLSAAGVPAPEGEDPGVEIREIFESQDFGENLTPELRARDERIRAGVTTQTGVA